MTRRKTWLVLGCLAAIGLCGGLRAVIVAQADDEVFEIAVLSARPVSAALLELEQRQGWAITYEDPVFEYADDVQDTGRRALDEDQARIVTPRETLFRFNYRRGDTAEPESLIKSVLDTHAGSGGGGRFRVLVQPPMYHVLPVSSRDVTGRSVPRQSRLDVRISVPADEGRTLLDFIETLLHEVDQVSGVDIFIGVGPIPLFTQTPMDDAVEREVARDALVEALARTGRAVSWHLLCQPSPQACAINFRVVNPTTPSQP